VKFIIVTGLSGAGRTTALHRLEDLKYFCVDNLIPKLIPEFADSCLSADNPIEKVAVAVDIRMGDWFSTIYEVIEWLRENQKIELNILFLDASDEALIKRFKSTRRPHPMSQSGNLASGIHAERCALQRIKDMATRVIDTSSCSLIKLYNILDNYYEQDSENDMLISVISFGYKRGIPLDADMVFDMRFLPNPFYVEELKLLSGKTKEVQDYVFSTNVAKNFIKKLLDLIEYTIPMFIEQDKKHMVIAIGCTGGMHRSVAIAEHLFSELKEKNINVYLEHRDLRLEKTAE